VNLRRSTIGFVLFLLAALSRTTMPLAMAQVGFDPIANAPICFHDGGSPVAPGDGGAPLVDHQHCAFACCQVFVAAPDALAAPSIVTIGTRVEWRPNARPRLENISLLARRARGPPSFS
jgi:hypothetical protein